MMRLVLSENGSYLSLRLVDGLHMRYNVREIILVHHNVIAVQEICCVLPCIQLSLSYLVSVCSVLLHFSFVDSRKGVKGH